MKIHIDTFIYSIVVSLGIGRSSVTIQYETLKYGPRDPVCASRDASLATQSHLSVKNELLIPFMIFLYVYISEQSPCGFWRGGRAATSV